ASLVLRPVMPPRFWVASTKGCKDAGSLNSRNYWATEHAAARSVIAGQSPACIAGWGTYSAGRFLGGRRRGLGRSTGSAASVLAHLVEVLRRAKQHVDEHADERWHEADHRRECDQPGTGDAAPGVLVRPVADREPEHGPDRDQARPGQ